MGCSGIVVVGDDRSGALVGEAKYFNQGDPGGAILSSHHRSMRCGGKRRDHRGLQVIRGRDGGGDDLGFLGAAPVVVHGDEDAVLVEDFQSWIGQFASDG